MRFADDAAECFVCGKAHGACQDYLKPTGQPRGFVVIRQTNNGAIMPITYKDGAPEEVKPGWSNSAPTKGAAREANKPAQDATGSAAPAQPVTNTAVTVDVQTAKPAATPARTSGARGKVNPGRASKPAKR